MREILTAAIILAGLLGTGHEQRPQFAEEEARFEVVAKAAEEMQYAFAEAQLDDGESWGFVINLDVDQIIVETQEQVEQLLEEIKDLREEYSDLTFSLVPGEQEYSYEVRTALATVSGQEGSYPDVEILENIEISEQIVNQEDIQDMEEAAEIMEENFGVEEIGYAVPLEAPVVSSLFGERWGRMHKGLDFACDEGTEVYAADAGTIEISSWVEGYGYAVYLNHEDGSQTRYAHLSETLCEVGETVEKGTLIALSGNTGNSTGPHLHFEILENGEQVDPYPYIME